MLKDMLSGSSLRACAELRTHPVVAVLSPKTKIVCQNGRMACALDGLEGQAGFDEGGPSVLVPPPIGRQSDPSQTVSLH